MSKCNTLNCSPEEIMAAANSNCSNVVSPEGYNAEKAIYDQSYKDLINNFGYEIDYYLHTFNVSGANLLYGEEPTAIFYGPISIKMYMEIDNETLSLQKFGFDAADDFTGYVHIDTFEKALSAKDFFIQTSKGDILQIDEFVETFASEDNAAVFVTETGNSEMVLETMIDPLSSLYDQAGGSYTILDKFIENNHLLEPKSGDLIDFVQLGCDRPGGRCSKIFEITERMDQDLAGGLNPMLGHYIWRVRAKRYEHSFEPGAPTECKNEQVFDNPHNGVTDTDIPTDEIDQDKSYDWDINDASKDVYDMDINDNDIYGSYY